MMPEDQSKNPYIVLSRPTIRAAITAAARTIINIIFFFSIVHTAFPLL